MMAEGSIVLSAGDNPSFVLHNLTAGTTYIVNATVLLLTDSTVFTTLPGTDSALLSTTPEVSIFIFWCMTMAYVHGC